MNLLKSFGIGAVAVVATAAIMIGFEFVSGLMHPELAAAAAENPGAIDPSSIPTSALLLVLAGMCVGALLGGWIVGKLAGGRAMSVAAGAGTVLTLGHFVNLTQLPHPLWFAILGTLAFLPAYLVAASRAYRR